MRSNVMQTLRYIDPRTHNLVDSILRHVSRSSEQSKEPLVLHGQSKPGVRSVSVEEKPVHAMLESGAQARPQDIL